MKNILQTTRINKLNVSENSVVVYGRPPTKWTLRMLR